jgi:hypothetical protein
VADRMVEGLVSIAVNMLCDVQWVVFGACLVRFWCVYGACFGKT